MVEDHEQETLTYADFDLAGRPVRKTKLREGIHVYTGKVRYNDYELPADFTELVGADRKKHSTAFQYDNENRVTSLTYDESTDKVSYTYDALGRVTKKTVHLGTQDLETNYSYVLSSETNGTTGLIQTITQNGVTLTYEYDNNGNITSVSDGTKTVTYAYDAIGQLIRVDDPYDTRSGSDGTTWTFEYDLGGNILNRKRYAYTDPEDPVPATYLQRILYAYGDSTWKDKLTSYNGVAIDTDDIGNITEYGAWTYQWRHGRELVHMSRSQYQPIEVDFEYNEDGLRTKKTITDENNVVTITNYTLHGKNIVHLTKGNQQLHFFYDGQGKPSIVEWNNNGTIGKYAYVYNLQGDVIALVNSAGTKVVNYTYDAWGKPLSKTGTLAGTLGTLSPFRYRGYVYDDEIDFYYLRSRYYNANRGRFINSDSVFDIFNLFVYCKNNPLRYVDNEGTDYKSLFFAINIFVVAAFATALLISKLKTENNENHSTITTSENSESKNNDVSISATYSLDSEHLNVFNQTIAYNFRNYEYTYISKEPYGFEPNQKNASVFMKFKKKGSAEPYVYAAVNVKFKYVSEPTFKGVLKVLCSGFEEACYYCNHPYIGIINVVVCSVDFVCSYLITDIPDNVPVLSGDVVSITLNPSYIGY